jgi:peptidoglycan/LPS O-acetylase OafA/YrhL
MASSIFLDCLRLSAALTVFIIHAKMKWFPDTYSEGSTGDFAHGAVVVFFVLSGFVISFTTSKKNRGKLQYMQARLSKLSSVFIPGLIIAAIVQIFIFYTDPVITAEISRGSVIPRYLITFFYFNEAWFISAAPPINIPLWSLSFEFWYYTIFGFWMYIGKGIKAKLILLLVCLIAGPKILLLMPIWLLGVLAYKLPRPNINVYLAWFIVALLLVAGYFYAYYVPSFPTQKNVFPLFWAWQFITDYFLGIIIAAILWVMPEGSPDSTMLTKGQIGVFRKVADLTFPIYVLHMPFLFLFKSLVEFKQDDHDQFYLACLTVFLICAFIGYFLNRALPLWVSLFNFILQKVKHKTQRI